MCKTKEEKSPSKKHTHNFDQYTLKKMIKNQQTRFAANLQTWSGSCLQVDRLCFVKTVVEMCPDLKLEQALSNGTAEHPMWLGREEGLGGGGGDQAYHWWELPEVYLYQKYFCCDKMFVKTFCLLCHDKHVFAATKVLSWQAYFRHDKRHVFFCDKHVFVATK